MKIKHKFLMAFLSLLIYFQHSVDASICGKVELDAAFLKIDVLESGKTVNTMHMRGVRGDANIVFYKGFCLKPTALFAWGDGTLSSGTLALGHYTPIFDKFCVLPAIGFTYAYLHTRIDLPTPLGIMKDLKEKFRSGSTLASLEMTYRVTDAWTVSALFQYAWCTTHTKIGPFKFGKSHSKGPNYGLGVDYNLNDNWALSAGFGYNTSLSKEKHGLRGVGGKLGIAYFF